MTSPHRSATLAMAAFAFAYEPLHVDSTGLSKPAVKPEPRYDPERERNHMPHQGKRECARRVRQMQNREEHQ